MCGIVGVLIDDEDANVNQQVFDALTVLQHRGQDAAGMVTTSSRPGSHLELRKDNGLVKEVFSEEHMRSLLGNIGVGHVRYPTAGTKSHAAEAQPLYTNYPHGLCIAHNGTLTNTKAMRTLLREHHRHVNTGSDSEVLLNVFAVELESALKASESLAKQRATSGGGAGEKTKSKKAKTTKKGEDETAAMAAMAAVAATREDVLAAAKGVIEKVTGVGLLGFRDPNGIRPLVFGSKTTDGRTTTVLSSESVAIDALGLDLVRDVAPGEAVLIDFQGQVHTQQCAPDTAKLTPCIFEYVYFARPDSVMDGVPVYESRLRMGESLAHKIMRTRPEDHKAIDVVIPIPDTSRASALQCAYTLGCPFREGFIKNRYIARTFIMPGQAARKKSVRLKLNTIKSEFAGKNVLLVDDSIVRGTTAREIVDMAWEAGAKKVFFVSAAPAIKWPNVYGIDIPTRTELIAHERTESEIAASIGVDWLIYQDLPDLEECVRSCSNGHLSQGFESSCFSGCYVTPEIDEDYLQELEASRVKKPTPVPAYAAATSEAPSAEGSGVGALEGETTSASASRKKKLPPAGDGPAAAVGQCEGIGSASLKKSRSEGHLT